MEPRQPDDSEVVISATVRVPSLGLCPAKEVEVQTYVSDVLVVQALHRLVEAEQVLLSVDSHSASQSSNGPGQDAQEARANAQEAWAYAMLELVHLYDLHLAVERAIEDDHSMARSQSDSEWEQDRVRRHERLSLGADFSEVAAAVYGADSRLFLKVYDFLERHTQSSRVGDNLVHIIRTTCKIDNFPFGDPERWLRSIEHLAGEVLLFLKYRVSPRSCLGLASYDMLTPEQFAQEIQADDDIARCVQNHVSESQRRRRRRHVHISGYGSDGGVLSDDEVRDARWDAHHNWGWR